MLGQLKYHIMQMTGLPAVADYANRHRLLVVTYHGLYDGPRMEGLLPATFVHIADMERQLSCLRDRYHIIDPRHLSEALESGSSLPENAALVTFDDGYESVHRLAFPVLKKYGIGALVFLATDYVIEKKPLWFDQAWELLTKVDGELLDKMFESQCHAHPEDCNSSKPDAYLSVMKKVLPDKRQEMIEMLNRKTLSLRGQGGGWNPLYSCMDASQIQELSGQGITFGGHTHTHTILTVLSPSEAKREIDRNKKCIEGITGIPCMFFAYPNGEASDYNEDHKEILRYLGYGAAFSLTQQRTDPVKDRWEISRINVVPEDTCLSLRVRCTGIYHFIRKIRN